MAGRSVSSTTSDILSCKSSSSYDPSFLNRKKIAHCSHPEKRTTWIDPRTKKTREFDINNVKEGELPYGWDEAVDPEIGVYYIEYERGGSIFISS